MLSRAGHELAIVRHRLSVRGFIQCGVGASDSLLTKRRRAPRCASRGFPLRRGGELPPDPSVSASGVRLEVVSMPAVISAHQLPNNHVPTRKNSTHLTLHWDVVPPRLGLPPGRPRTPRVWPTLGHGPTKTSAPEICFLAAPVSTPFWPGTGRRDGLKTFHCLESMRLIEMSRRGDPASPGLDVSSVFRLWRRPGNSDRWFQRASLKSPRQKPGGLGDGVQSVHRLSLVVRPSARRRQPFGGKRRSMWE